MAGYVEIMGLLFKVWCKGTVSNLSHETEMTSIALKLTVDDILRGPRIPADIRKTYTLDGLILVNGNTLGWEHDRGTEDVYQIRAKARKLSDCPFDILWTCPDEERKEVLIAEAPNDNHWFTTTEALLADPHGPVWVNSCGEIEQLEETNA